MKILLSCVIGLVLACSMSLAQRKPPNYSLDEMNDIITSFSCGDKVVGGYYADPETDCQMFHVCVKIPGVGVQDFRFLCPNDTSFDQENQICDDWYNIDCEVSTLYYSDNFDLYRLGQDSNNFGPSKATPIPLGPSSIAPRPQKSRRPISHVNNAVSEPEDDQYLFDGDRRASSDLLRGSSSGNFFNRNQGKEDPEDDYVAQKPREQELVKNQKKKPKNNVRKLLTGKRPLPSAPAVPPSPETYTTTVPTTTYNVQKNRYNTVQRNRQTTLNNQNYQTTTQPSRSFNNNFSGRFSQNGQEPNVQQQTTTTQGFNSFKSRGTQNYNAFNKKTESTDYYQETTTYNYQNNGNSNYNQGSSQVNNYQASSPTPFNSFKTNTNYNQGSSQSNYYQTPTSTNAPFNNYRSNNQVAAQTNYQQTPSTTNTPIQYNNQQSTTIAPNYNYQNQNANTYQNYNSPSTENYYDATTFKQNYYQNYNQKQTTVNYDNYYKTSTQNYYQPEKSTEYPATDGAPFQNYYEKVSRNSVQPKSTTNNQYSNINSQNAQASINKANYDAYNSYQNSNADKYDEPSQGESLKTAPSSNIRPSDLNSFTKNYQKPVGFNTTLTASYNFNTAPSTTQKPTSKYYQTKQYQEPSSGKSYNQSPSTVAPTSNRGNSYYAQSTTAPPKPRPFSKPAEVASTSKPGKEKDVSYDYAYYDDAGAASEYDGYEPIGEEFSRTTSAKKTRTTKSK